ncbi:methylated-DNA--[protein]-cysteine S-methyltransferase [Dongia sp.]|uniref:methylated-DNA--[protein]-cysteine S-methyltransferase n=1 Tax=Dongia sp. TaxID=1977262 RepID=UPI0035B1A5AE
MSEAMRLRIDRFQTPIGEIIIILDSEDRLRAIDWTDHEARMMALLARYCGKAGFALTKARNPADMRSTLSAYFAGDLGTIDKLPTETGGTDFQRRVWRELRRIPYGKTISYADLARRIGKPTAIRAVGLANGANPVSIVIPCHRVIGSDGSLTGYGGGLDRKQWLLAHEGALT